MNSDFSYKNCFFIQIDSNAEDCVYLMYEPLENRCGIISKPQMETILKQSSLKKNKNDICESNGSIKTLPDNTMSLTEIPELIFLPNFDCNFRCSYCYAGQSHSKTRLSLEKMKLAVDHFFEKLSQMVSIAKISFVGGGEPMLAWNNIRLILDYASCKAANVNKKAAFCFITNGSILTNEILDILKNYKVFIRVSFEIIPEIQEMQRGNYSIVSRNIKTLCENHIKVAIRSIITENNVDRMNEMIDICRREYPTIKRLDFEPVASSNLNQDFYDAYISNFFDAMDNAESHNIMLNSILNRIANDCSTTFCPGDFCITPDGSITICHRVASKNDVLFEKYIYGELSETKIMIDDAKYRMLQEQRKRCWNKFCINCFARYNCGGGCSYQRDTLNERQFEAHCNFVRKFLTKYLIRIINKSNGLHQ